MLEEASYRQALALERSFSSVLKSLAALEEVFVMTRNESCVLATVASPLHYSEAGRRALAWSRDLTMQLSARKSPDVVAYYEEGGEAEFFDDRGHGFLKVFPCSGASASAWNGTMAAMAKGFYPLEDIPFLRKTNHLTGLVGHSGAGFAVLSAGNPRRQLDTFFAQAIERESLLTMRVPCGMLRADLTFSPTEFTWKGLWLFAVSPVSGCHLRLSEGCSIATAARAGGVSTLDIFDAGGEFVTRLTSRPKQHTRS